MTKAPSRNGMITSASRRVETSTCSSRRNSTATSSQQAVIAVRQETLPDSGPRRHASKDNSRVRPASGAGAQWWYDRVAEDQEDVAPLRFTRVLRYCPDKSVAEEDSPRRSRRW